jgi:hypothetical protein
MFVLSGCVGAANLEQGLRGHNAALGFLREVRATPRTPGTLTVDGVSVDGVLPPETTVRKTGGWVVPLLFFNAWKGSYQANLGAAQLQSDCAAFITESLREDLKRGAKYELVEKDGGIHLDVHVTKITMNAPVQEGGTMLFLLLAVSWSQWIQAAPVDVAIQGEIVARRDGVEVFRKPVLGRARAGGLKRAKSDFAQFAADFDAAMAEALSLAVKGFDDSLVEEVNRL